MTTALDVITDSMKLLGVLQTGEVPTASEANDALFRLNAMLDAWNAENLTCFCDQTVNLAYTANKQLYTVGVGGDFNVGRPDQIIRAWARDPSGQDIPQVELLEEEWDNIALKNTPGTFPVAVWYNPQFPLGELNVWPNPNATLYTQYLRFKSILAAFPTLAASVLLPAGYLDALIKNLAIDCFPYFGGNPPAWLTDPQNDRGAARSKERIEHVNVANRMTLMANDAPRGKATGFEMQRNIITDTFNPARGG